MTNTGMFVTVCLTIRFEQQPSNFYQISCSFGPFQLSGVTTICLNLVSLFQFAFYFNVLSNRNNFTNKVHHPFKESEYRFEHYSPVTMQPDHSNESLSEDDDRPNRRGRPPIHVLFPQVVGLLEDLLLKSTPAAQSRRRNQSIRRNGLTLLEIRDYLWETVPGLREEFPNLSNDSVARLMLPPRKGLFSCCFVFVLI